MYRIYLINFLLAISTTVGMTIIPFLITDSLGLSLFILGLIEGSSEFLSNVFRLANGVLFDKIKNKRILFVSSTALAFFSKSLLFLPTPWAVLFAKIFERIANGTFASPRDAYVASLAKNKGTALGFLNVSKTFGCILGPLIVSLSTFFIGGLNDNLHYFIVLCCVLVFPALLLSFTLNVKQVKEKIFSTRDLKNVYKSILPILILTFLFFMGRFNDGLLMIHLKQNDFPEWFYLSTIAIFNTIMLVCSPIIGQQIDKGNLKKVLYLSIGSLVIFNICFYEVGFLGWSMAIIGILSWGIQRAGAQIVLSTLVFKSVEQTQYGTAIGLFYLFSGVATMFSSFICGYMATNDNFTSVFLFSGFFALFALVFAAYLLNQTQFRFSSKTVAMGHS